MLSESGECRSRDADIHGKDATRGDYLISDQVPCRVGELREREIVGICWGGWIRTTDYLIQSQEPYRLATPQLEAC